MGIMVKEYHSFEKIPLKELSYQLPQDHLVWQIIQRDKFTFLYVAYDNERAMGILVGWINEHHPNCTYIRILSNADDPRYDVEQALLSRVTSREMLTYPLQTSIWETARHMKRFYEGNDFKEVRRTYMPKLGIAKAKSDAGIPYENKQHIRSLNEIYSNESLMNRLAALVKRNYEKSHRVNPVKSFEIARWKKLILAEDVLMQGTYVSLNDAGSEIVAYSFLHHSEDEQTYELGWCGCREEQDKDMLLELIQQQIDDADDKQIAYLLGEFDSTDMYAMEVYQGFPFIPSTPWLTYHLKEKSE